MSGAVGVMASAAFGALKPQWAPAKGTTGSVIECSSRPQKKATAHHMKTRPKKTQPWDVKRKGPTPYPPLPSLPPDWSFEQQQQQSEAPPSP